ncbi:MAG: beta-aspartyl-peptidase [Clostridia bacterium]|nr:beta-aspartyl-peptidase [Clostridia bacterium]
MFILLKAGECFAPERLGCKDVFIAGDKICKIEESIPICDFIETEVINCTGKVVCPGFIDQHVHIAGGGGENGPSSRVPEIMLGQIISAGVTTVVGVLGMDSITRNIAGLLAKARALDSEGLNTYIYTGSYQVPASTLTGKVNSDIANIDKVIGVGEVAISDYRSVHPSAQMLKELAWEAKVGAMVGGKAGVMHIHVGDGKQGILPLVEMLKDSEFPMEIFVPTHLNRNLHVFGQATEYAKSGGNIDLTSGEKTGKGLSVPDAVERLLRAGVNVDRITVSSDGNGSIPSQDGNKPGVGRVMQLYEEIRQCIAHKAIPIESALKMVTSNVAKILGLYPAKGALKAGSDADILVLDRQSLAIEWLIIKGKIFIRNGNIVMKGVYEN